MEYYVKIPYDRINLSALWSRPKEESLVIPASKRYAAEIGALEFHEIPPIAGKKDSFHAIIRKKYTSVKITPEQMIDKAIESILEFYKKNSVVSLYKIETYVRSAIEKQTTYTTIDQWYTQLSTEQFGWQNYFRNYSLRAELLRWKTYYQDLPANISRSVAPIFESSYSIIWEMASEENSLHFIMNHGGFDIKNLVFTPDVILLDNEKLHPGWPGIDFADILITYVRFLETIENYELWDILFHKIPSDIISTNLLVGWVILGTYKEAISTAACLKPISKSLHERIKILLHFVK